MWDNLAIPADNQRRVYQLLNLYCKEVDETQISW